MSATSRDKATSVRKPQQARAEETRLRIIEEARKAFAEKGFDGANTRDLAAAAGTTHAAIRYHFGTKDQLWRETVAEMFSKLREELTVENATGDGEPSDSSEGLRRFVSSYIRYCAKHPDHARIMMLESARGGERVEWMAEEFIKPGHTYVSAGLENLIKQGILPDVWPVSLIYIVVAVCQLPFVLSKEVNAIYDVDVSSEKVIQAHTDAVLALLLRA